MYVEVNYPTLRVGVRRSRRSMSFFLVSPVKSCDKVIIDQIWLRTDRIARLIISIVLILDIRLSPCFWKQHRKSTRHDHLSEQQVQTTKLEQLWYHTGNRKAPLFDPNISPKFRNHYCPIGSYFKPEWKTTKTTAKVRGVFTLIWTFLCTFNMQQDQPKCKL